MKHPLIDTLRGIVGEVQVMTEDIDAFQTDWRKRAKEIGRAHV